MAMLAERRFRKRYNLVPRGKALYEDDSRFGTKMLEKMGWSKGKGLGANENGSMDFVRVRYKNDANGLGYEDRDDQWTQHEESFSGLLKSLNGNEEDTNDNTQEANDADDDAEMQTVGFGFKSEPKKSKKDKLKEKFSGESLEEKSKSSKARVHYKKFTRGKDLARYSEKDLANIFGKKATEENVNGIYEQFTAIEVEPNENSEAKEEKEATITKLAGVETINIGLSVQDYFKQKMEEMKKRKMNGLNGNKDVHESSSSNADNINDSDEPKKKKKKKNVEKDAEETEINGLNGNQESPSNEEPKKKKKKKNVEMEAEETVLEEVSEEASTNGVNGNQESTSDNLNNSDEPKKKKKKKNIEKEVTETVLEEAPKKKKKNKEKDNVVDVNENSKPEKVVNDEGASNEEEISNGMDIDDELVKSKKSKKKNKVTTEVVAEVNGENAYEITTKINIDNELVKIKKSKKKNKVTSEETEVVPQQNMETVDEVTEHVNTNSVPETNCNGEEKRKKKKKQKIVEEATPEEIVQLEDTQKKKKAIVETNPTESNNNGTGAIIAKNKKKNKSASNENTAGAKNVDTSVAQKSLNKPDNVSECPVNSVSNSTQNEITLDELIAKRNSYNVYSTSSFCAEKFGNADLRRFVGSNIKQILGYGLSEDIQLQITVSAKDQERITQLWKCTLNKYKNAPPKNIYNEYKVQALLARKTKQKIPRLQVKSYKRKNAFSGI